MKRVELIERTLALLNILFEGKDREQLRYAAILNALTDVAEYVKKEYDNGKRRGDPKKTG